MTIIISSALILVGFVLLIKGADWMVDGASALAKKNNISDLAIGLTIVAFGTSAPELVVNTIASFDQQYDIVFGNIIGSNNFNLFLILGAVAIVFPISVQSSTVWKEIPISFLATIVLFFLVNGFFFQGDNLLSRLDGLLLLVLFFSFLYYVYKQLKSDVPEIEIAQESLSNAKIWGFIVFGLAGLVIGGKLVVANAIDIAEEFGVSEKIISLTIIAAGTSLPELITSLVAAFKKNSDIAIGNIVGSNIFNLLLVLSISSFVNPIQFNPAFNTDIYLLLGGTVFLFLAMFVGHKKKLGRIEGGILLAVFAGYMFYLISKEI